MRVLLADGKPALRSAMRLLLEQEADVNIVAEVADVETLLAAAEHMRPDLVLLDWELPGLQSGALAATVFSTLNACCPNVKIVVLSGRPKPAAPP